MQDAAALIHDARAEAGVSLRELARRADVSYPTICRIEHRRIDPTTGTLAKLLGALGQDLELGRTPAAAVPTLAELADAWEVDRVGNEQPDWTRLRSLLDFLERRPELAGPAIRPAPAASGSALLDSLLAGIAEKVADDAQLRRPAWTARVPALDAPWAPLGTPRMQDAAARKTPPQLAARLIALPAAALWRHAD